MSEALARTQSLLQRHLLEGDDAIRASVLGTERVPVETRLAIYANAYRERLIEALENGFPALARLLGDAEFRALAARYIETHPSRFASIRWYGHEMASFLRDSRERPELAELACWEWAMTEAFDAADAAPLEAAALTRVAPASWPRLRLELHPSVRRVDCRWNTPQLWKALTAEQPSSDGEGDADGGADGDAGGGGGARARAGAGAGAAAGAPAAWLLWRKDLQILYRSLAPTEAAALDLARAGAAFEEICGRVAEHFVVGSESESTEGAALEAAREAARLLRGWVEDGLIVGMSEVV